MSVVVLVSSIVSAEAANPERPIKCERCEGWNAEQDAFQVFGNTWYVGVAGLSAILIGDHAGLVLIDGDLPQSVPQILEHLDKLGFRPDEVKVIASSHAHYDHAGGIEALRVATGAEVVASPAGAAALRAGQPTSDDPQSGFGKGARFPAVARVREVADGEGVMVGNVEVIPRFTPGHAPGATTWTWRTCVGPRCLQVVYADSLNAVSTDDYRFADHPEVVQALRSSIATIAAMPCDVLLTVHPDASDVFGRRETGLEALVDPGACRAYAEEAGKKLDERLTKEGAPPSPASTDMASATDAGAPATTESPEAPAPTP